MKEVCTQEIDYQLSCTNYLATILLDMIYLKTKEEFDCLLEANNIINIVLMKATTKWMIRFLI